MIAGYVGLASLVLGLGMGWTVHGWKTGKEEAARLHAQALALEGFGRRVQAASAKFQAGSEQREARDRVVVKEIERVVEKPVYREQCLDDDGLRVLTDDVAASNTRRGLGAPVRAASSPGK